MSIHKLHPKTNIKHQESGKSPELFAEQISHTLLQVNALLMQNHFSGYEEQNELTELQDVSIFTKGKEENKTKSLFKFIQNFTQPDGKYYDQAELLSNFSYLYRFHDEHIINRDELILNNVDHNLEYLINEAAYHDLVALLYLFDFYHITNTDVSHLIGKLNTGDYSRLVFFLNKKLSDIYAAIEENLDKGFLLIGEFRNILKIINRILIITSSGNENRNNTVEFVSFLDHFIEKLLGSLHHNYQSETYFQHLFLLITFELCKIKRNYTHIINEQKRISQESINTETEKRIQEIKKANNGFLEILELIEIPNKQREKKESGYTTQLHINLLLLSKYRQYESNGFPTDSLIQEKEKATKSIIETYYRNFYQGIEPVNPDEKTLEDVVLHFRENIGKQKNLQHSFELIYTILHYCDIKATILAKIATAIARAVKTEKVPFIVEKYLDKILDLIDEATNKLEHEQEDLKKEKDELEKKANTDPLTKIGNRRAHDETLKQIITKVRRANDRYYYFALDIDHFKNFNDTYGHQAGDRVLQDFAEIIQNNLRDTDYIFRYGGEEFSIIAKCNNDKAAFFLAKKINKLIASMYIFYEAQELNVTTSIGITPIASNKCPEEIHNLADKALYAAKHSGRNTSVFHNNKGEFLDADNNKISKDGKMIQVAYQDPLSYEI